MSGASLAPDPTRVRFDAGTDDVTCFTVRNGFYWAHIFVRHGLGETGQGHPRGWVHVSVLSDFGSFGYCWSHIGGTPWWKFLAEIGFSYAMQKMMGQRFMVPLNVDDAAQKVRQTVVEWRRDGTLSKEDARDLWDAAPLCGNSHSFFDDLDRYSSGAAYRHEMWDMRWDEPSPEALGFWREIWPHFIAGIQPRERIEAFGGDVLSAPSRSDESRAEGLAHPLSGVPHS